MLPPLFWLLVGLRGLSQPVFIMKERTWGELSSLEEDESI